MWEEIKLFNESCLPVTWIKDQGLMFWRKSNILQSFQYQFLHAHEDYELTVQLKVKYTIKNFKPHEFT